MSAVTHISRSPSETEAIAHDLAGILPAGTVIGLSGDLGAGKTQFARGFARGLGVKERVQSPTFALLNTYFSGRLPLHHIDFYRLDSDAQIIGAGLVEYLEPDGIALIEWIERWNGPLPGDFVRVVLETLGETERRITVTTPDETGIKPGKA
ncbi:MAG: tRNA (adenosine(37)-N6)-threonylcarbamoyltransferase complex ATPase subunit type 1 TsaE [Pedosphaera sp.]|nr:tRNA (adenosine(37)-N6)-threonylcarbamoyltransferase complex ATPase subunit type 1 TsaE [Pedosphaera sp.]